LTLSFVLFTNYHCCCLVIIATDRSLFISGVRVAGCGDFVKTAVDCHVGFCI
jgi:hypothetical protein